LPELKNAELIDGLVYVSSPVSNEHGRRDAQIITWLGVYAAATIGCSSGSNETWLMFDSAPQPDAYLRLVPQRGGHSRLHGKYCSGAAELIVEVCLSSAPQDLGPKQALYQPCRCAGVYDADP
jgi:hypothetical protein